MRVLLFGTFDHLHPGHQFLIREALKRGDVTVVVARDANALRIKGRKPEQSETERADEIQKVFPDVTVALGSERDFLEPIRTLQPDLILLGYDQQLPPGLQPEQLHCPVERLPAFKPEIYKSSLRRKN